MYAFLVPCLLLMLAALITGFVTGSATELPALRRRFRIGCGIGVLLMLMFSGLAALNFAALREFFTADMMQRIELSAGIPLPIQPEQITDSLLRVLVVAGSFLLLFLYLLAFNCRRREGNRWFACGWILLFGTLFSFTFHWGYCGLAALVAMVQSDSSTDIGPGIAVAFSLLTFILLAIWTYFALKNEKRGAKRLLAHAGIMTGTFAACWLLGLALAWIYGSCALAEARKRDITPWRLESGPRPELKAEEEKIARFHDEHKDFELPFNGIGDWRRRPGVKNQELIPEHKRNYTLKWFDTPEFEALLPAYEKLQTISRDKVYLSSLNCLRAYTRIRVGRAALYSETGQPEKILPELRKAVEVDLNAPDDMPGFSVGMTHLAIRALWISALISIGPDGPEYAPFYREIQERLQAHPVRIPNDAGFYMPLLETGLNFEHAPSSGRYTEILNTPAVIASVANELWNVLSLQKMFSELEQAESFQTAPGRDPFPDGNLSLKCAKHIALRSRETIALGTTALALKRYRCEKGHYPRKLEELVPEYLEKLPPCPFTGKPLHYESDGKDFELSVADPEQGKLFELSSRKDY